MARDSNAVRSKTLRLSTTVQVLAFLDQLARTGFYGKNRAEVAEQILRSSLRAEFRQGLVELPKKKKTAKR